MNRAHTLSLVPAVAAGLTILGGPGTQATVASCDEQMLRCFPAGWECRIPECIPEPEPPDLVETTSLTLERLPDTCSYTTGGLYFFAPGGEGSYCYADCGGGPGDLQMIDGGWVACIYVSNYDTDLFSVHITGYPYNGWLAPGTELELAGDQWITVSVDGAAVCMDTGGLAPTITILVANWWYNNECGCCMPGQGIIETIAEPFEFRFIPDPLSPDEQIACGMLCCDDGDPCNGEEAGLQPDCQPGSPPDCDDDDLCTEDSCEPFIGCVHEAVDCADGNPCTEDSCAPTVGCVYDEVDCQDGDACNGVEFCDPVLGCRPGPPLDCDDGNLCTMDDCEPTSGCIHDPVVCDDGDECTWDECDPATGQCRFRCYNLVNSPPTPGPPSPDDRTFLGTNANSSSTSISLTLATTRYAGETTAFGSTLEHTEELIAAGFLGSHAELTITAYHVDCAGPGDCNVPNSVYFNGQRVDTLDPQANPFPSLRGPCGDSGRTVFQIPIDKVKFPIAPGIGGPPTPRANSVLIQFDAPNDCRSLAYAALEIKVMSPIILVHGNSSNPEFFERQGFAGALDAKHLEYNWRSFQKIELETAPRAENAKDLSDAIPVICTEYGVDSIHLVAHSKGGLDVRDYLQHYYPTQNRNHGFKVLSLTTLSTPHNGSVGADLLQEIHDAVEHQHARDYLGFPYLATFIAERMEHNDGMPSLTTFSCSVFNSTNIRGLPADIVYSAVGGDADSNGNGTIDFEPVDEYAALRVENEDLADLHQQHPTWARRAVNAMYQTMGRVREVGVTYMDVGPWRAAMISAVPADPAIMNDTMVTVPSAHGRGSYAQLINSSGGMWKWYTFLNHANVASPQIAEVVTAQIKKVEETKGDLR